MTVYPELLWAQRSSAAEAEKNVVYLTIAVPNLDKDDVELSATGLKFAGADGTNSYACELEFFAEIDEANSHYQKTGRGIAFVLRKKHLNQEYWPRLCKDKARKPYIKTDFDKWVDEDEQETEAAPEDPMGGFDMSQMLGGAGGGMGGMPDFSKMDPAQLAALSGMSGETESTLGNADESEPLDLEGEEEEEVKEVKEV